MIFHTHHIENSSSKFTMCGLPLGPGINRTVNPKYATCMGCGLAALKKQLDDYSEKTVRFHLVERLDSTLTACGRPGPHHATQSGRYTTDRLKVTCDACREALGAAPTEKQIMHFYNLHPGNYLAPEPFCGAQLGSDAVTNNWENVDCPLCANERPTKCDSCEFESPIGGLRPGHAGVNPNYYCEMCSATFRLTPDEKIVYMANVLRRDLARIYEKK